MHERIDWLNPENEVETHRARYKADIARVAGIEIGQPIPYPQDDLKLDRNGHMRTNPDAKEVAWIKVGELEKIREHVLFKRATDFIDAGGSPREAHQIEQDAKIERALRRKQP